ncbi:uncharacterized protein [Anolis sagrei]|uniref:uncharacterized protein n=1 Tax=Anolis sagrei TaxID=38937 RepID=UPI003520CA8E
MITVVLVLIVAVSAFIWKIWQTLVYQLTLENLNRVRDMLERSATMDEGMRTCFQVLLEKFFEEPPWVMKNAHVILKGDDGREVAFAAGKREWKIIICAGGTQYHVRGPSTMLDEATRGFPLSVENLQKVRNTLEDHGLMDEGLRVCFLEAIQNFHKEPLYVKRNAQMVLKGYDGKEFEFGSGQREWKISIFAGDYNYHVTAPSARMYLSRLRSQPQRLNIQTLKEVRDGLKKWNVLTPTLKKCFMLAIQKFDKEPTTIKSNAQMVINFDENEEDLKFIAGNGDIRIYVTVSNGDPQYQVMGMASDTFLERLCQVPVAMRAEKIREVCNTLAEQRLLSGNLSLCFLHIVNELPKYPKLFSKRPKMHITWDESSLLFISPHGDCEISVQCEKRTAKCIVNVNSLELNNWELFWERIKHQTHPLSIETLEKMRNKVSRIPGVPSHMVEKFNQAIHGFYNEMTLLQNNARLVIEGDDGEMVFLSGKGKNKIEVCRAEGRIAYFVKPSLTVRAIQGTLEVCRKLPGALFPVLSTLPKLVFPCL